MGSFCCKKSAQPVDTTADEPLSDAVKPPGPPESSKLQEEIGFNKIAPAPVVAATGPPPDKYDDGRPEGIAQAATAGGGTQQAFSKSNMSPASTACSTQSDATGSGSLNANASESLKQYAKRNRPKKDATKFKTHAGSREANGESDFSPLGSCPIVGEERSGVSAGDQATTGDQAQAVSDKSLADKESLRENLSEKMKRFDIFDDLDEERLKEFDDIFKKVKDSSNYEAHKRRSKKIDPNKFSTCSGIATDQDTGFSMLT